MDELDGKNTDGNISRQTTHTTAPDSTASGSYDGNSDLSSERSFGSNAKNLMPSDSGMNLSTAAPSSQDLAGEGKDYEAVTCENQRVY
jgi:hypothetical protein